MPEVHLHFVTRVHFHPAERQLLTRLQSLHEPQHTEVAASKAMLGSQILMDALGRQALVELALNDLPMRPAQTVRANLHCRAGVQLGTIWFGLNVRLTLNCGPRAEVQVGTICTCIRLKGCWRIMGRPGLQLGTI